MTTAELHKILDDENRKLSLNELKQVIYDEMIECARRSHCVESGGVLIDRVATSDTINPYYAGQENALGRILNLLERFDDYIKLPYLLFTSKKFACVIWRDKDGKVNKTYTMPIEEAKRFLKAKENESK